MKKLFVVDTDKHFQAQIHEICPSDQVELRFYSSGMEIFLLLATEKPHLIFLDLEIEDLNEFVMRDLLKKITVTYSIPLLVTYSEQSDNARIQYEKLNYKANGYLKKPIAQENLKALISQYLKLEDEVKSDETDTLMEFVPPKVPEKTEGFVEFGESMDDGDDSFSDDNIDRLVRGGIEETESLVVQVAQRDDRESTNPFGDEKAIDPFGEDLLETRRDESSTTPRSNLDDRSEPDLEAELGLDAKFDDSFLQSPLSHTPSPPNLPETAPVSRGDRELENQVISLERQNEFLRTENKKLLAKIQTQHTESTSVLDENQQLKNQLDEVLGQSHLDRKELQNKQSDLSEKVDTLTQENAQLVAQLESQAEQLARILKEQTRLEQQVDTLTQQLTQLQLEKAELDKQSSQLHGQLKKETAEKDSLQQEISDINNRLTDKEREMVAVNHEFEKLLQEKSDQLIQQTEDRLNAEFKQKEERLIQSLRKFQEETKRRETELRAEIDGLSQSNQNLDTEKEELKKREDSLNRTVSTLAEEKVILSEQIASFEKEWTRSRQVMEEMEAVHRKALDQVGQELEGNRSQIHNLNNRIEAMAELLKNALSIALKDPSGL